MTDTSLSDLHRAFVAVHEELREEGSEFDFRFSLADHLFTDALDWSRNEGEGHVTIEDERKDLLCYDDSDPPFPAVVCETKRPAHDLDIDDYEQLETYMNGVGSASYGILTNGHEFRLYEYVSEDATITAVTSIDIEEIATTGIGELSEAQQTALAELEYLHRDRYVEFDDENYFRETYREVPVQYRPGTDDRGYDLFLDAITDSLDELTGVLERFFEDYRDRDEDSYPREFLDTTFPDWKEWREYTGKSDDATEVFCRETAYIVLNRILFARIAEDKGIVGHTRLSSRGMADALARGESRPYLDALLDTYDRIDDHYPGLYELGIFDWWWVSRDKRGQFSDEERRRQRTLDDELDYALSTILERLNRFDFAHVNRDILGHVYEDYLPKKERKELGEYYTPLEVVQFMLDSIDYRASEDIGQKQVLDPACGSGTFLTEVTERLIQHFLRKFDKTNVHQLNADEARTILERIEDNVYGIDINPFAAHISQINLLFRTIDLYDKVTEKDPYYTMDGFEIHVADTLSPTVREKQSGGMDTDSEQSSLQQFADYNGRARAFIEDRNAVDRIKEEEAFDAVVANPPYVRIQKLSGVKETYSAQYASAIKNFDIYVPFIERGIDWLTDDGQLAYICPDRLVMADYAEEIRNQLGDEPITSLVDFKETDVFDVPTPYPCIVTLDREQQVETPIRCARFAEKTDGALDEITHLDEWTTPERADGYELFEYPQAQLVEDNHGTPPIWKPMPEDEREVFDRIERRCESRLGQVTDEVFQGIITGRDKLFVGEIVGENDDGTVQFQSPESDEPYPIEPELLRRLLKGKEIERWKFDWTGRWVLFPYEVEDGEARVLTNSELQSDYPNAWAFFEAHEDSLKSRENGKWREKTQWWAFSRKQNVEKFERTKLMVGVLRKSPSFVPDTDGRYYFVGGGTAGGYGIHLDDEIAPTEDETLFVGAQMNSKLTEFYHKHVSFVFNDKHYSYGQTFLEPLPVTLDCESKDRIVRLAEEIRDTLETATDLSYETATIESYLSEYPTDSTILDLAEALDLGDDDYRQGPIRTNDTETVYQVVLKRGHTIDFESETVRDFVYELLTAQNSRLGRSEILTMPVPARDDVLALVDEYESDEARIEELEAEAEDLQAELDDLLLREVYDFDDDAIDVIEDFLEVW